MNEHVLFLDVMDVTKTFLKHPSYLSVINELCYAWCLKKRCSDVPSSLPGKKFVILGITLITIA